MKKYLILTAAALVAFAACTKVETDETVAASQKISFQVAKYMAQTKADPVKGTETSLLSETDANGSISTFKTNAWYHSPVDGTQYYMKNVDIKWNVSTANQWAPDNDYYWPKTGTINFYSYAGTPAPTTYNTEGSLVYTDKVIAYNDNVLVADAAYRYNQNKTVYQIDNTTTGEGVPTLFRHYLAKLAFNAALRTTDAKKSATNHFKVEILDATVKFLNKGTLTLTNADPATSETAQINPWTNANASKPNVAWVAGAWDASTNVETVDTLSTPAMQKLVLNLAENALQQTETDTVLLAMRTVMPQVLDGTNATFYIKYKVSSYLTGEADPYAVETIEVTKPLTTLVPSILEWNRNTKYTYTIVIDPIANKILFDPAVEEWAEVAGENPYPWLDN